MRLVALLMLVLSTLAARAELAFDQTAIELQPSLLDREILAEFRFRNDSKQVVKVLGLSSSCGCTAVSADKTSYAPGERGIVRGVFTIGDRIGLQQKSIFVDTDHPGRIHLQFSALIPNWAELDPRILKWMPSDERKPKSLLAKVADGQIRLTATASAPALDVSIEPTEVAQVFRLIVTPKAQKLRAVVTIKGEYPGGISKLASVFISVP